MKLRTIYAAGKNETKGFDTEKLRNNFLVSDLFQNGEISLVYLHYDRLIVGGVVPTTKKLDLKLSSEIGSSFFLEHRELGIINIGGAGTIEHDGGKETLENKDGLYLPVGNKKIIFSSKNAKKPANFYLVSTFGTSVYPVVKVDLKKAKPNKMGSIEESNTRTIYQYFHPAVCKTNSLLMGLTILEKGNMWNTMPCHTHERRTECYLYLDVNSEDRVFHFMGEPSETRHLVLKNQDFVISPPWSIHTGVGTSNYAFIWAMGGENLDYKDMQFVKKSDLK
ncbi:5-dehydro-4-deoxy-D-glucuronate isomerase [[Mycoplasma] testudinis]|uniref:5-dehydro-4-deoxy-D-glucuronate isomerase n=1 Tax=[Mycoplasma] testudinis TaxID=33924 RepID=UPI000483073B|nr:5-dehydro-4-deoxy-D-glucuronate isomerase [[Mycoplasma] testudinis]